MIMLEISQCRSREELEDVVDLCDRAFQNTPREYFARHVLCDATLRPEHTLIGRKGGRIVSSVQIFPRVCWIDGRTMPFAGIGNVATDPAERKSGYAGQLMTEAVRRMTSDGFPFSMLTTTINPYYAKFGYVTVPREVAVFAGPPRHGDEWAVRKFDRLRDLAAVRELYEGYNLNSAGPIARDDLYWRAQFEFCGEDPDMFLLAERAGHVGGYIRGCEEKGAVQVLEFGAAEEGPVVFHTLLSALSAVKPHLAVKMFLSEREKGRLSPLPPCTVQTDTDTMILVLEEASRPTVEEKLKRPGKYMFWVSDFF
jgi:predicted acetyltransferase